MYWDGAATATLRLRNIEFRAVDTLTGLKITVWHDNFGSANMVLRFPDGRFLDDRQYGPWGRARTVLEPGTFALLGLGLLGLGMTRRRAN